MMVHRFLVGALLASMTLPAAAQVNTAWVHRFDSGVGSSFDEPWALTVDQDGSVFVTGGAILPAAGKRILTIGYERSGAERWLETFQSPTGPSPDIGRALATDAAGNVYVGGSQSVTGPNFPGPDMVTLKYDSAGVLQWSASYDGTGADGDAVQAIAVDGPGNVYVSGTSTGALLTGDIATIQYDAAGAEQWVSRFEAPGGDANVVGVALSSAGHLYVGAAATPSGGNRDYLLLKYSLDGALIWSRYFDGPDGLVDRAMAMAIDGDSNVYLTGEAGSAAGSTDYSTIKVDPDGIQLWQASHARPGLGQDLPFAIAVDPSGDVIVSGQSGLSTGSGAVTLKYDGTSGAELWSHLGASVEVGSLSRGRMLALDQAGAVYLLGQRQVEGRDYDIITYKLSPDGLPLWEMLYGEEGPGDDWAIDLAVSSQGDVNVLGMSHHIGTTADWDFATIQYRQGLFSDGFESGTSSAWSATSP